MVGTRFGYRKIHDFFDIQNAAHSPAHQQQCTQMCMASARKGTISSHVLTQPQQKNRHIGSTQPKEALTRLQSPERWHQWQRSRLDSGSLSIDAPLDAIAPAQSLRKPESCPASRKDRKPRISDAHGLVSDALYHGRMGQQCPALASIASQCPRKNSLASLTSNPVVQCTNLEHIRSIFALLLTVRE
jgi:hypothetical protein